MHILEQYALNCGAKISKPYIYEKYFPLPSKKYITLHTPNKFPSRTYDYWPEVVINILDILKAHNIEILQIGGKDEQPIKYCLNTNGQTDFNQLAFIIKNSILHVGVDSLPVHLASYYGKKIVALFSNMYPSHSGPIWSDKEDLLLLESEKKGNKPTYSFSETPKTINTIKPETIAKGILKLLNINANINLETIYIGEKYIYPMMEIYPSEFVDPSKIGVQQIIIRMDYCFNLDILQKQLSAFNNNMIFTNKEIDIDIINLYKKNIQRLFLVVSKENKMLNFIKKLSENLIKFEVLTYDSENNLNEYKLDYMNHELNVHKLISSEDAIKKIGLLKDFKDVKFKSNKLIAKGSKLYPSLYHLKRDIDVSSTKDLIFPEDFNNKDFICDIDFYYLYKNS